MHKFYILFYEFLFDVHNIFLFLEDKNLQVFVRLRLFPTQVGDKYLRSDKFNVQFYSSCSAWSWTAGELLALIARWGRTDASGSSTSSGTVPAHPDTVDAINNAFRK